MKVRAAIVSCVILLGCSDPVPPAAAPEASLGPRIDVRMDAPTQARMGVRLAPVAAASVAAAGEGYARVLDPSALAAIDAELGAAQAAAAASQAEYRRLASLAVQDQAASTRAVEAARAQAAADSARAALASRRVGFEWGPGLERLNYAARARLLSDVAAGRAALVRIDAPDIDGVITEARLRVEEEGAPVPVAILGPAATADAQLQSAGVLAVVRGDAARTLPAGRLLRAELRTSAPQTGFLVPETALIRADNSVWVFVRQAADGFVRRDVSAGRPVENGWFVPNGFEEGETIAIEGAASLHAAERGPGPGE